MKGGVKGTDEGVLSLHTDPLHCEIQCHEVSVETPEMKACSAEMFIDHEHVSVSMCPFDRQ